jgi:2-C-methyl-D-erythritol 2,4-cyclodiphosphate synthase
VSDRVGLGEDLHRLVAGRPLILGGVRLEYELGLAGHSDGDVVLHAIADAMLGAAGLGDIGERFPDDDESTAGIDSGLILADVVKSVAEAKLRVVNVDVVVHAERPRLGAARARMRARIAEILGVEPGCVNVKAKTGEGLDAVGRGEAIACRAVVSLSPDWRPTHSNG